MMLFSSGLIQKLWSSTPTNSELEDALAGSADGGNGRCWLGFSARSRRVSESRLMFPVYCWRIFSRYITRLARSPGSCSAVLDGVGLHEKEDD